MTARDPIDRHVGARIRLRRVTLGLSQTDIAAPLGLTFQQIQKYEKGANRIGASNLHRIAQRLGVPVAYFYDGIDTNDATPADSQRISDFIGTPDAAAIIEAFSRLPETGKLRRSVLSVVRNLADAHEAVAMRETA